MTTEDTRTPRDSRENKSAVAHSGSWRELFGAEHITASLVLAIMVLPIVGFPLYLMLGKAQLPRARREKQLIRAIAEGKIASILGVEAPMWTETVRTLDDIDALAFPRIGAAAEAAWSPAAGASGERTWESFRTRVGALAPLWARSGIRFTALPGIDWARED